jgi:hypothetical protein
MYPPDFTRNILQKKLVLLCATQGGFIGALQGPGANNQDQGASDRSSKEQSAHKQDQN